VPWASLGKRLEWSVLCRTLYRVKQPQRRGGVWVFLTTIHTVFLIYYIKNGMTQGHMFVAKRSRISHDVVVA
jgi:hypothetical protein